MTLFTSPLTIVDVETTGMSPVSNRIIEIGLVRIEQGEIVEEYSTLVNPETHLPREITILTGIYARELEDAPTFTDVARKIKELTNGTMFVAHNARFDYAFVKHEFKRLGESFHAKTLDTVALSRKLFPEHKHHDLSSLIERFEIPMASRHRALDDAKAVWEFLQRTKTLFGDSLFEEKTTHFLSPKRTVGGVDSTVIDALPDGPGVYLFYNAEGNLLYVGKSVNIKDRVMSHFYNDTESTKELVVTRDVSHIEARSTAGEISALLLESELIKEYSPIYNRRLRMRRHIVVGNETTTPEGYLTIELTRGESLEDTDPNTILGLFRNVKQAKEKLYVLAQMHQLCPKLMGLEKSKKSCFAYQLGNCLGACIGKEDPGTYNARFAAAFATERIQMWPYNGPIIIEERSSTHQGQALRVQNWKITAKISYEDEYVNETLVSTPFDIDSYRILANAIFHPKKGVSIKKVETGSENVE